MSLANMAAFKVSSSLSCNKTFNMIKVSLYNTLFPLVGHRSLRPSQDAASVLQRYRDDNPSHQIAKSESDPTSLPPGDADDAERPGVHAWGFHASEYALSRKWNYTHLVTYTHNAFACM